MKEEKIHIPWEHFSLFSFISCVFLLLFIFIPHGTSLQDAEFVIGYLRILSNREFVIYIYIYMMMMYVVCRSNGKVMQISYRSVCCVLVFRVMVTSVDDPYTIHMIQLQCTPFNGHAKNADRHCKQCFSRGLVHPVTDCFERMEKRKKNITTDPRPWIGTASDYAGSRPTKVVSIRRTSDALTTHRMPMHEDNDKNRCLAGMDREYSLWCTARPSARHCLGRNLFWTRRASGRVFFIGVGPQVLWIVCTIAMCAVA